MYRPYLPLPYTSRSQWVLESSMVYAAADQQGLGPPSVERVPGLYQRQVGVIAVLLSSREGRDELFPALAASVGNENPKIIAQRQRIGQYLSILFEEHASVASVAEERGVKPARIYESLQYTSRRSVVVKERRPDLLNVLPRPFCKDTVWPVLATKE